jgi:hypothetical protein
LFSACRRLSFRRGRLLWVSLLVAAMAFPRSARAQSGNGAQGGLEFLLPIGARTVGMGQAGTALAIGSDALWWNPALIARGPREASMQITQTLATQTGADASIAVIYGVPRVGAVALSLRYLNYGEQDAVSDTTQQVIGKFVQTGMILAATFAAPFGDRFAFGLTAKVLREAFPCTGDCTPATGNATSPPQTGALDLGAQYLVTSDSLFTVGAAVRNVGFKLQVNDTPQADALPGRLYLGFAAAPRWAQLPKDVRVRAAADLVWRLADGGMPGLNLGGELSFMERYQLRGGYVVNGPTGSGLTFGAGVSTGKLHIDLARMLNDVSQQSGVTPTYVALRYLY